MSTIDVKSLGPNETALEVHDDTLRRDVPQVDWTAEEEKRAKLK